MLEDLTKKISGVVKSKDAEPDSEVRQLLSDCSIYDEDVLLQERYRQCSMCEYLKEEFRLLGVKVKDKTPTCGQCGCNLNLKIPLYNMSCPIGRW
jgi:uncharacterized protein (UPF0179 family)